MRGPNREPERKPATVPVVQSLLAWSRRLTAVFMVVGLFAIVWPLSDARLEGRTFSLELRPFWAIALLGACLVNVCLVLFLRRLAGRIDAQVRAFGATDILTGLSNRFGVMERLTRPGIAVLYMDLDRFKSINDTLGHETGDEVLRVVGQRLRRIVRSTDLAARLGGDEFVIVVEDPDPARAAREVGERIRGAVALPIKADRREVFTTASIGIAVRSTELSTPNELLRAADLALYRAKRQGRDRIVSFNETAEANVMHRLDLERDLWRAMDRDELAIEYLPEVNIQSGAMAGLEALIRWRHPTRGLLQPASFLSIAEETGSVNEIGLWVLESACRDRARWRSDGGPPLPRLSVNLSPRQLAQPDLARRIEEVLLATSTDPAALMLELSERALLDGGTVQAANLDRIRAMGMRISIDDFGTGHAPLSYLRQWPADAVKIDRELVANLEFDDARLLIVQAIISLAHDLGLEVTAEGIETPAQLSRLHDLGCDYGQGYYLSEPIAASDVPRLLRKPLPSRTRERRPRRASKAA